MSSTRIQEMFDSLTRFEPQEEVKVAKCFQPYVLQPKTEYSWEQSSFMRILNKLREEATRRGFDPKEIRFESSRTLDYYNPDSFHVWFGTAKVEFHPGQGQFQFNPKIFAKQPEKMQLLLDVLIANHEEACVLFSNSDVVGIIYEGLEAGSSLEHIVARLLKDDPEWDDEDATPKSRLFAFLRTQKPGDVLTFLSETDLSNINEWYI